MGRFVEGADRRQSLLLPETLDDYVTEDNSVRVIEVDLPRFSGEALAHSAASFSNWAGLR